MVVLFSCLKIDNMVYLTKVLHILYYMCSSGKCAVLMLDMQEMR